ncbi:hemerythrin domain-containing protein [Usitatibacter palustris]|uniref:Hemerythrin-like domain-containing protein n=1 Tax=Usitatibacter palustris TaxID=2732487 RepID=A0A6M4H3N6_9PROT|nr:hemerythrin domain-containing protein [Usitatibacter palustris]QJR14221.1 hypothetical protein DSM104440_01014 [Usitatibacter palustris]
MGDPIASWHAEHVYFNHLLDLLEKQVERFHSGQRPDYELMLDIIRYLREYSDQFHHPREEVAFDLLAARCNDLAPLLDRLTQEHRVIAIAGERLEALLQAALDDALFGRAELEAAAATYLVYYRHHIAREEGGVLARAKEALTPEDWEAARRAAPSGADPLHGPDPAERFRRLRHHLAANA